MKIEADGSFSDGLRMNVLPQAIALREHPHRDHRREVERRDAGDDAERLADLVDVDAGRDLLAEAALEQVRDAGGELEVLEAAGDLAERVGRDLAVLGGEVAPRCPRGAGRRGSGSGTGSRSASRATSPATPGTRLGRRGTAASTSSTEAKSTSRRARRSPGCRPGRCGRRCRRRSARRSSGGCDRSRRIPPPERRRIGPIPAQRPVSSSDLIIVRAAALVRAPPAARETRQITPSPARATPGLPAGSSPTNADDDSAIAISSSMTCSVRNGPTIDRVAPRRDDDRPGDAPRARPRRGTRDRPAAAAPAPRGRP